MNRISDAEFFVCVSPHSDVFLEEEARHPVVLAVSESIKHLWFGDRLLVDVTRYEPKENLQQGFYVVRCNVVTEFAPIGGGDYGEFLKDVEYVKIRPATLVDITKFGFQEVKHEAPNFQVAPVGAAAHEVAAVKAADPNRQNEDPDPRASQNHDVVATNPIYWGASPAGSIKCGVCGKPGRKTGAEVFVGDWVEMCDLCMDALAYQLRRDGYGRKNSRVKLEPEKYWEVDE